MYFFVKTSEAFDQCQQRMCHPLTFWQLLGFNLEKS